MARSQSSRRRLSRSAALVLLAVVSFASGIAVANGLDFFEDAVEPGPNPLYYYGYVRDAQGRAIPDAEVRISIRRLGIILERRTGPDGAYQTHDIARALESIGEEINPSDFDLTVVINLVRRAAKASRPLPTEQRGKFRIDFVVEPR